jgi:hypothetical protein
LWLADNGNAKSEERKKLMPTFNISPMIRQVHDLVKDDESLDEHWFELLDVFTTFGFIVDRQECDIRHSAEGDHDLLFCIVLHGRTDFPALVLKRLGKKGWLVQRDNSERHWAFVQREDGLYCLWDENGESRDSKI